MAKQEPVTADGRVPLWLHPEWWTIAGSSTKLLGSEREAVNTAPSDPKIVNNFHFFRVGTRKLLWSQAREFYDIVKSGLRFGDFDHWKDQRKWFLTLIQNFYGTNDDGGLGTFSITSARRSAARRSQDDGALNLGQSPARTEITDFSLTDFGRRKLGLGDLNVSTRNLRMACGDVSLREEHRVAITVVPRYAFSTRYGVGSRYKEFWASLALPGDDEPRLNRGEIPAIPVEEYKPERVSIRTTAMVSLVRISRTLQSYTILSVEIHPVTGEILSLRWGRMPLSVAMLIAAPVEHIAASEALRK